MDGIKTIIQGIYEIQNNAVVTPGSLLDNAKLDNYSYVNYCRKDKDNFVVEMECICEDGVRRIFYYIFDKSDNLLQVRATPGGLLHTDILFDREIELGMLLSQYKEIQNKLVSGKAG